jgi:hypothetical protein
MILGGKLPDELVDELLAGAKTEEEIVGPGGLLSQLTKRTTRFNPGSCSSRGLVIAKPPLVGW